MVWRSSASCSLLLGVHDLLWTVTDIVSLASYAICDPALTRQPKAKTCFVYFQRRDVPLICRVFHHVYCILQEDSFRSRCPQSIRTLRLLVANRHRCLQVVMHIVAYTWDELYKYGTILFSTISALDIKQVLDTSSLPPPSHFYSFTFVSSCILPSLLSICLPELSLCVLL